MGLPNHVTINSAAMNRMVRKEMIGVTASGVINRSDFGLDRFITDVSDTVEFRIEIEFLQGSNEESQAAVQAASLTTAGM